MAFKAAAQLVNALMSYIALARKWRPRTFAELVGQEHVNKPLINSLKQQRLHHAYLFTGTRGTGKTSVARLLAKALNCEQGITAEPCLQCTICLGIEQGHFVDLIEVDGASRTRVEDTRDILDNVQYAPTSGRFKIYLIDEVHMLSQHSFNALLKTLEEPPAHVKFLFATTDPQKIPITVLSRCLQFNLKPLSSIGIVSQLQMILQQESVQYEPKALDRIATAARGSMRDALSLLDQAIASSNTVLAELDVQHMLGHTRKNYALQLLQALAANEVQTLLALSQQLAEEGGDCAYVLEEMLQMLHQVAVSQTLGNAGALVAPEPEILALSQHLAPQDTHLFYQIVLKGLEELSLAPVPFIGFEMTLLRLHAFKPASAVALSKPTFQAARLPLEEPTPPPAPHVEVVAQVTEPPMKDVSPSPPPVVDTIHSPSLEWSHIVSQLQLSGFALNALENSEWVSKEGGRVQLRIAKGHDSLFTNPVILRVEQQLSHYYNEPIKLVLLKDSPLQSSPAQQKDQAKTRQIEMATSVLEQDLVFQQLQHEFSAELVPDSVALQKDSL